MGKTDWPSRVKVRSISFHVTQYETELLLELDVTFAIFLPVFVIRTRYSRVEVNLSLNMNR